MGFSRSGPISKSSVCDNLKSLPSGSSVVITSLLTRRAGDDPTSELKTRSMALSSTRPCNRRQSPPSSDFHKERKKNQKRKKGEPVETAATVGKSKTLRCFFPQLLGKAEHQTLGFSTVPTGPTTIPLQTLKISGTTIRRHSGRTHRTRPPSARRSLGHCPADRRSP